MEINGIQIRDIKDIQDALTAFQTLNIELENLGESMSDNLGDYKELTNNQKEILEAINTLLINAQKTKNDIIELANNFPKFANEIKSNFKSDANAINDKIKTALESFDSSFKASFSNLKSKLDDLDAENKKSIERAINSINFNRIQKSINLTVKKANEELLESVDNFIPVINKIESTKDEIETFNNNLTDSIDNFNKASKSLNAWKITAVLFVGLCLGAGAMLFFGLQSSKQYYYADMIQAKNKYDTEVNRLEDKYIRISKTAQFVKELGIKKIVQADGIYLIIDKNRINSAYHNENYYVWKIK